MGKGLAHEPYHLINQILELTICMLTNLLKYVHLCSISGHFKHLFISSFNSFCSTLPKLDKRVESHISFPHLTLSHDPDPSSQSGILQFLSHIMAFCRRIRGLVQRYLCGELSFNTHLPFLLLMLPFVSPKFPFA